MEFKTIKENAIAIIGCTKETGEEWIKQSGFHVENYYWEDGLIFKKLNVDKQQVKKETNSKINKIDYKLF